MTYTWTDASALWELEHGIVNDGTDRKATAREYLEMRLDGYTTEEIKEMFPE